MSVTHRARPDRRRQEDGAVAVMVALMTTMLIGIMAFVTDFGMAYANKAAVQNGADAAALAVARQVTSTASPTINCTGLALASAADPSLRALAEQYFANNSPRGGTLAPGTAGLSFSCTSVGFTVAVTGTQDSPAFFGQIYGASKIPITQSAKAVVGPAKEVTGLRPFAVCQMDASLMSATGLNYTISFDNADAGCGYAPGNWGILDFDGGSNPTGDTADWILNGYSGSVSTASPSYIDGDPGAPGPGALDSEMDAILGIDITLPVFDDVTGSGNNTKFRITGFVTATMCGWKFNNKSGHAACFTTVPHPVPKNYLQVMYKNFVPIGQVSTTCQLGNVTCDNGVRLYQLAE